jgi:hypothetical protein
MNSLSELKRRFTPRSRWGAVSLGPRREFGSLTWTEAEDRPQPQDGAQLDEAMLLDAAEVASLPKSKAAVVALAKPTEPKLPQSASTLAIGHPLAS